MEPGPGSVPRVFDMPTLELSRNGSKRREIDVHILADNISAQPVGHAFIEQVGPRPGEAVSRVFAFGKGYGEVIGVLVALGIPHTFVPPAKWKKALGVPAAKDGSRARASQLLPGGAFQWQRVKDDGRAEAALICLYGKQFLSRIAA